MSRLINTNPLETPQQSRQGDRALHSHGCQLPGPRPASGFDGSYNFLPGDHCGKH